MEMESRKRYLPFEDHFLEVSERIEYFLKKLLLIFLVILILTQLLFTFDFIRNSLTSVEKIEGAIGIQIDFL